jgi:hypothetical protein
LREFLQCLINGFCGNSASSPDDDLNLVLAVRGNFERAVTNRAFEADARRAFIDADALIAFGAMKFDDWSRAPHEDFDRGRCARRDFQGAAAMRTLEPETGGGRIDGNALSAFGTMKFQLRHGAASRLNDVAKKRRVGFHRSGTLSRQFFMRSAKSPVEKGAHPGETFFVRALSQRIDYVSRC